MLDATLTPSAPVFRPGTSNAEIEAAAVKAARKAKNTFKEWR